MRPPAAGRRRRLAFAALGVLVVAVLAYAASAGGDGGDGARARELASELRCPDCESLSAQDSHTDSARAIRADIRRRVARGQSDAAIRRAYVARYGESILLRPEGGGLGFLVWGVPVAAVIVALTALGLALRRWSREPRLAATAADAVLVAREQEARHPGRQAHEHDAGHEAGPRAAT